MSFGYDIVQREDGWYFRNPTTQTYEGPYESQAHAGAAESWWFA